MDSQRQSISIAITSLNKAYLMSRVACCVVLNHVLVAEIGLSTVDAWSFVPGSQVWSISVGM